MQKNGLRTWVEIDKKAIRHNYQIFRSQIGKKCQLMSVVKSNAYGHSLLNFSKEMEKLGVDWLGVDSIVEGEALRKEKISPKILVLGHTLPEKITSAIENRLSLTVSTLENLKNILRHKTAKKIKIHLKIDTGMHRQGFFIQDLKKAIHLLKKNKDFIEVEGIYTHFAAAKNPSFPKDTQTQLAEFEEAVTLVRSAGFNPIRHAAATSGTLLFPKSHFDMVRVGIGLYGLWPSKETEASVKNKIKLEPVLFWKTRVSEIKNLKKGDRLGYDFTERVLRNSKIAILPVGYWHGYPRSLSSVGHVIIQNKACKILGRVAMDMTVADVTEIRNIKSGEDVILMGKNISADYLADLAGTVNYEIVTRINPLIRRILV
ncbi:MAG: alanine racemase [Parcubacteria group bacterium]|jgi:alanine racemase